MADPVFNEWYCSSSATHMTFRCKHCNYAFDVPFPPKHLPSPSRNPAFEWFQQEMKQTHWNEAHTWTTRVIHPECWERTASYLECIVCGKRYEHVRGAEEYMADIQRKHEVTCTQTGQFSYN